LVLIVVFLYHQVIKNILLIRTAIIYLLRKNGDEYSIVKEKRFKDIDNIISIKLSRKGFILLDSLGNVHNLVPKTKNIKTLRIKNIIQIDGYYENIYSLDINGNIYRDEEIIIINIIKMFQFYNKILFLGKNNDVYGIDDNKIIEYSLPKNIKNIFLTSGTMVVLITDEKIFCNSRLHSNILVQIDKLKNAIKVDVVYDTVCILNNVGNLYIIIIYNSTIISKISNVKDFTISNLPNKILILFKDNTIMISTVYGKIEENERIEVSTNTKLISAECLLMDNKMYSVDYIPTDGLTLNEIKI